jgi:hypothetical protein
MGSNRGLWRFLHTIVGRSLRATLTIAATVSTRCFIPGHTQALVAAANNTTRALAVKRPQFDIALPLHALGAQSSPRY